LSQDLDSDVPGSENPDVGQDANLLRAARRINSELHRHSHRPMMLSQQARDRLTELHADYLADLAQEAIRTARRGGVQTVDEFHVEQASSRLGLSQTSGALETTANTLGGVFAGAGIAFAYELVFTAGPHSTTKIATAFIMSIVGFVLLSIGITTTWSRRSRAG
jgi:histone H3/H4